MHLQLIGKTALITGSSRGLGKAIALELAKSGANVILNASKSSSDIDNTLLDFQSKGFIVTCAKGNVSIKEDVEAIFSKIIETHGTIDILVNNAGITKDTLMLRMNEEDWDNVIDTNLKSAFLCTKSAVKIMMRKKTGKIINISSIVGVIGNAGQANYAASKAGMIGLTKSIAKEFASRNITCNAIAPGFIASNLTEILADNVKENYLNNIPLKRFGTPEEVANLVSFLASDCANYITGQVIHIDGGMVM